MDVDHNEPELLAKFLEETPDRTERVYSRENTIEVQDSGIHASSVYKDLLVRQARNRLAAQMFVPLGQEMMAERHN